MTITVTTLSDVDDLSDGQTSLREAIFLAENQAGADTITFDASLSGMTIMLGSALSLTGAGGALTIDGDINNDGIADITISGDSDGDGMGDVRLLTTQSGAVATGWSCANARRYQ